MYHTEASFQSSREVIWAFIKVIALLYFSAKNTASQLNLEFWSSAVKLLLVLQLRKQFFHIIQNTFFPRLSAEINMFNSTFIGSFTAYRFFFAQTRTISIFGSIWKELRGTERVLIIFSFWAQRSRVQFLATAATFLWVQKWKLSCTELSSCVVFVLSCLFL